MDDIRDLKFEEYGADCTGQPFIAFWDRAGQAIYGRVKCELCLRQLDAAYGKLKGVNIPIEGPMEYETCKKPKVVLKGLRNRAECMELLSRAQDSFLPGLPVFGRLGAEDGKDQPIIVYTDQDLREYQEGLRKLANFVRGNYGIESEMGEGEIPHECMFSSAFVEFCPPDVMGQVTERKPPKARGGKIIRVDFSQVGKKRPSSDGGK